MAGLQYPKHAGREAAFVLIWKRSDWCGSAGWVKKSSALWVCCCRRWRPTPAAVWRGRVSAGQRTVGLISGPGIHLIRSLTATPCCSERRIRRKVGRLSSLHNVFLLWRFYLQTLTAWNDVTPRTRYSSLSQARQQVMQVPTMLLLTGNYCA